MNQPLPTTYKERVRHIHRQIVHPLLTSNNLYHLHHTGCAIGLPG